MPIITMRKWPKESIAVAWRSGNANPIVPFAIVSGAFGRRTKLVWLRDFKGKWQAEKISNLMARYLARACPRYNDYVGIVIREVRRNIPLQAVNGRCQPVYLRMA
jgi:hypothetical protein